MANSKHKRTRQLCTILAVLLLFVFCLSGCAEDSFGVSNKIRNEISDNSDDTVLKIYIGSFTDFFYYKYIGAADMDTLNTKVWDTEYGYLFNIRYVVRPAGSSSFRTYAYDFYKDGLEHIGDSDSSFYFEYIDHPERVFDPSIEIKEIYILQKSSSHSSTDYIYYVTDIGDYILMIKDNYYNGEWGEPRRLPYLFTFEEYGKFIYDYYSSLDEPVINSGNITFPDEHKYILTEPLKKNISHYVTEIIIGSVAIILLIVAIVIYKRRNKAASALPESTPEPQISDNTPPAP